MPKIKEILRDRGIRPTSELKEIFQKIATSAVEYFNSDPELEIDVRFYDGDSMSDGPNISVKDLDKHSNLFKQILKAHCLDLESYDGDSYAIVKNPLWKQSEKLKKTNDEIGVFESADDDKYLEPEEVVPDMVGEDYNDEPGVVKIIKQVKNITNSDFIKISHYDESGWLPSEYQDLNSDSFRQENFIDDDTWLVAIRDDNGNDAVFVYGGEGFLVPATERWKNSKKLKNSNQKTGILEHLKSFKDF